MGARAYQRLKFAERSVAVDFAADDRERVAGGMAQDRALVENEIGLVLGHRKDARRSARRRARSIPAHAARLSVRLIGRRKRLDFLDLHLAATAFERAVARLVAQHFGAALVALVTLTQLVSHRLTLPVIVAGPCGSGRRDSNSSGVEAPAVF